MNKKSYKKWTFEEKQQLILLVQNNLNEYKSVNWDIVANTLSRTKNQCQTMFSNTLGHTVQTRKNQIWSTQETDLLVVLVYVFGKNFKSFSKTFFEDKSENQLKTRYGYLKSHKTPLFTLTDQELEQKIVDQNKELANDLIKQMQKLLLNPIMNEQYKIIVQQKIEKLWIMLYQNYQPNQNECVVMNFI